MIKWFFYLISIFPMIGFSQHLQKQIDSISFLLEKSNLKDSNYVNLLNEQAFLYYSISPEKGLKLAKEAEKTAEKIKFNKGLAISYSRQSVNYWALGKDSLSMFYITKSLHLKEKWKNQLSYAVELNNRALNFYSLAEYKSAIKDHEIALEIFEKLNYTKGILNSYLNLGTVYLALNDYSRALTYFHDAKKIGSRDIQIQSNILTNIGLVYKNMKDYKHSLQYYFQALKLSKKVGDKFNLANTMANIGVVYDEMNKPDDAIYYLEKALGYNIELGNEKKIANQLTNLSGVYRELNQLEKAKEYIEKAVNFYKKTDDVSGLAISLMELSKFSNSNEKKIILQKEALEYAEKSGSPKIESDVLEELSNSYSTVNNYEQAYKALKNYHLLQESIFNDQKTKEILKKQLEHDFELRESKTLAEIERQKFLRNCVVLVIPILLFFLGIGFIYYRKRQNVLKQKENAEFKVLVAETELKALRAQLNPHFIFNSLNSILNYIEKNNDKGAEDYLIRFSNLMRMVLEYSEQDKISLSEDVAFLELYLKMEAIRMQNNFTYSIAIQDELSAENILVPPLLLQPFIENSIWHAFREKSKDNRIFIKIFSEQSYLICIVEDNGIGWQPDNDQSTTSKKSFGIALTKNRLEILNRNKTDNAELSIQKKSEGSGTIVKLKLPLEFVF